MRSGDWWLSATDCLYILAALAISAAVMSLGPDPWIFPS
jgi:hypothetical protein